MYKRICETKCSCCACGNIWFYGKQEVAENNAALMMNLGKTGMFCSGCLPALLIPDKKVTDLNRCPKCGSKAIRTEVVTYEVQ